MEKNVLPDKDRKPVNSGPAQFVRVQNAPPLRGT